MNGDGSMWAGRKVLVTGGGGFIGSHLTERLAILGASVRALVPYNGRGSAGWLDRSTLRSEIEVVLGDLRDAGSVSTAAKGVEVVFHLGALIAIPYSYVAPQSYLQTNIEGMLNVLLAVRAHDIPRLVHTSTSEAYGTAKYVPIDEDHPLQGQSPYAATKIAADKLAESFHLSYGTPVVTVRPFNTYGPRQSARAIIPTIITQALAGRRSVKLGNLAPTRDLNFVVDQVDGFLRAGLADGVLGETINLATGSEISAGALVELIAEVTGQPIEIETDPQRVRPKGSEVERLCGANAKARRLLDWHPAHTLREGLVETVAWLRANLSSYATDKYNI